MRYLSTFEVAEKWGISPAGLVSSATKTAYRAHSGQEAAGLFPKMQRNRQMPALKAENISNAIPTERRAANVQHLFTS